MEKAFAASTDVATFLSPTLLDGHVAAFLGSSAVPETLRTTVLENVDTYVNDSDTAALKVAGSSRKTRG